MKKKTVNAFTLVEMLIVIVIIGILIAALMPRMQAAQGRARDVARKTALSQVQSAIVTSQGDKGVWPGQCESDKIAEGCAQWGTGLSAITKELTTAGMNSVPQDPLKSQVWGLGKNQGNPDNGDYSYMVTMRNGTPDGGFVLMAKTEVEGGSNWVVCSDEPTNYEGSFNITEHNNKGGIPGNNAADITDIHPCTTFEKHEDGTTADNCYIDEAEHKCHYTADGQLRYILVY